MRRFLRRLATVTSLVTAIDGAILVALAVGAGWDPGLADLVAVGVASAASFTLHRAITFGDDPYVRWVNKPRAFLAIAALAGVLDVALVRLLAGGAEPSVTRLLLAKAAALALASGFRLLAYRALLYTPTREALATRFPKSTAPGEVRYSVVVPAFGEEERIAATVAQLRLALAPLGDDLEVVVVDDGSPDATAERAAEAGATVVRLEHNRGKGAAVRAGMLAARGRTIAFTDADLAYPPAQLLDLLASVEDEGWDVVVGSRFHPGSTGAESASALRLASGRLFNLLTASVLLGQYRDTQCGIKAFRSDAAGLVFGRSQLDGFAFDVEVLHLVERYRLSLLEVPVRLATSEGSTVRVGVDAARMIRDLFHVRRWAAQGRYDLDRPADLTMR